MRDKRQYLRDYQRNGIANCILSGFEPEQDSVPIPKLERKSPPYVQENIGSPIGSARGRVIQFNRDRQFGFIRSDDGRYSFVHFKDILPDQLGHKCTAITPGAMVDFTLNARANDPTKFFSTDVRVIRDSDTADTDPANRTEYCQVTKWNGSHGVAARRCGICKLHFQAVSVITEGLEKIQVSDWIFGNVETNGESFFLTNVVLHEPGFVPSEPESTYERGSIEAHFLALPDDPQPTPAPVAPQVYSETERHMTLKEIIQRRRKVAA